METQSNSFKDTINKIKQHFQLRLLLLRLQATEKVSQIASTLITVVLMAIIGLFLLIFLSITAGCWLASLTGSLTAGFGIVALFYLLLFLFIIFFLKKILQNFFINKLIKLLHKKS